VQVDLVDQSQFEKLTPTVGEGTSRFVPPAASSPICTASAGTQLRNVTPSAASRPRRAGGHEDRSVPGATVRAAVTYDIPAVSTQHGASYLDVLVVQTRTDYGSSGTAVWWPRKMGQRPERLR
jgi:hypothetical protein